MLIQHVKENFGHRQISSDITNKEIGTHKVLENEQFTIWQIRLAPGEELPAHLHDKPYFWTVLTDGSAHAYYDDGSALAIEYQVGDTRYFPDLNSENKFVHCLINTGDTPLMFVTVEFATQ